MLVSTYGSAVFGIAAHTITIEVNPIAFTKIIDHKDTTSSAEIRQRVVAARHLQTKRFSLTSLHYNAQMGPR